MLIVTALPKTLPSPTLSQQEIPARDFGRAVLSSVRCYHSAWSETDVTLCVLCVYVCLCGHMCVLPLTVGTPTSSEMSRGFDGVFVCVCVFLKTRDTV